MDPKVNGQIQKGWGWPVAAYLFLGGVGAGAYVIGAFRSLVFGSDDPSTIVALWISWPAVLLGSVFLVAELGAPGKAVLVGKKPGTSWMSRGAVIISLFMILAFLHTVVLQFGGATPDGAGMAVLSVIGLLLAVATMAYTGILLGASKGIPFWRSGIVPVLFAVSALVTGQFAVMIGMVLVGEAWATADTFRAMAADAAGLILLELLTIALFLQAAYRQPDSRESAERLVRKQSFVYGDLLLGLAVPLVLMLVLHLGMESASPEACLGVATVGAVLGLVGGLLLRRGIVAAGIQPTWNIAGFKFRRIARPKDPKPGIGLLPPT